MTNYLLGLATLPALAALVVVLSTLFARSEVTETSCMVCDWKRKPKSSGLPWWWFTIAWQIHKRTTEHKRAWGADEPGRKRRAAQIEAAREAIERNR